MAQRDWIEKDYYKVLGVSSSASKDEIKKAYRKLAQRNHPDANRGDAAAESRFKEISEAHAVLASDEKRAEYDEIRRFAATGGERWYGSRPGGGGGNVRVDIGDLFGGDGRGSAFEDLFGFGPRSARGADAETSATLTFDEVVEGTMVTLADGTKVRIPPGVTSGARIKVAGKGQPGRAGGGPGDLYVRVTVDPHPLFQLGKDGNLMVTVPITYPEATLGAKIDVPTLGAPVTVKVPPGTPNGKTLRVKGKGIARRAGGDGDLLVRLEVEIPQKLSKKEKELLEQFAAVHGDSPRGHLEAWMNRTTKAS
ncbi:MAG: DnaJ C-terminal domain-containing protein [Actinomycetota bacterium]